MNPTPHKPSESSSLNQIDSRQPQSNLGKLCWSNGLRQFMLQLPHFLPLYAQQRLKTKQTWLHSTSLLTQESPSHVFEAMVHTFR